MNILMSVWSFFATYVLQKAPYMVGFLTLLGYCLMGKKWYDTLAGTLKAIIGMLILNAGSGGLVSTFRPILAGLKDRFNLTACVIDPYYGQNAVTAGVEEVFGKGFSQAMTLLLIAFIVNILLVRFNKITKCRTLFTTGHVQVQQAATAYWLIMFALPQLLDNDVALMVVMAVILGAYWAVGSNLTVKPMPELSDGAGFAIAHQQMFGIRLPADVRYPSRLFPCRQDLRNQRRKEKEGDPQGRRYGNARFLLHLQREHGMYRYPHDRFLRRHHGDHRQALLC